MNAYELKQAIRRDRLEAAAERTEREASARFKRADEMASCIPFGQPILVGHYSEQRDRNFRARIHNNMRKGCELSDKAKELRSKAAAVGTGGISSDDPEAVAKLRAELEQCEKVQERMKAANKAIRANKTPEAQVAALVELKFSEAMAWQLIKPDFCGRIGFADYQLQNNNANIRRIKGRIEQLQARPTESTEKAGNGYVIREDAEENRVMMIFDGKPGEAVRGILKANGFKWSPSRGAWVRYLNNSGKWAAQVVAGYIEKMEAQ